MRTEAKHEDVVIRLCVDALYQYDDVTPDEPHHYQWRGFTASGDTKSSALDNLSRQIGGSGRVIR